MRPARAHCPLNLRVECAHTASVRHRPLIAGRDELALHIAASRQHMPGVVLKRDGAVRQCQGTALVDWVAVGQDGTPMGRGTNVFTLSPDGHLGAVVGFWAAPPA